MGAERRVELDPKSAVDLPGSGVVHRGKSGRCSAVRARPTGGTAPRRRTPGARRPPGRDCPGPPARLGGTRPRRDSAAAPRRGRRSPVVGREGRPPRQSPRRSELVARAVDGAGAPGTRTAGGGRTGRCEGRAGGEDDRSDRRRPRTGEGPGTRSWPFSRMVPPAGFEPALPPPEGGAVTGRAERSTSVNSKMILCVRVTLARIWRRSTSCWPFESIQQAQAAVTGGAAGVRPGHRCCPLRGDTSSHS